VDNNYLDLSMSKSGFIHTLPSGRLTVVDAERPRAGRRRVVEARQGARAACRTRCRRRTSPGRPPPGRRDPRTWTPSP
jgi:hypothetical protein